MKYEEFITTKSQSNTGSGFDPLFMPDVLYDFQRYLVDWAVRMGRCAIFADCGLGKTPMQLVWAENVVRQTNKPVLVLTPLAVSYQTTHEAEKFGIECERSSDGMYLKKIVVTNYQRLHHFNRHDFSGVVCDESSILKNADGRTKAAITEFMRDMPYRLLCTATAAPNDYDELGTSSEALGYLGYRDMLTRFFKQVTTQDAFHWNRMKYRFRGHAEEPFWRWICSWARVCRNPSDLGFEDGRFILPPLREHERVVEVNTAPDGMLFAVPAKGLREERDERRRTLQERCEHVADLADNMEPIVIWCQYNNEADLVEQLIPDAKQVKGSMPDEAKEDRLLAFQRGDLRVLVTKPKIGCFGLNWQHCNHVVTFPSHSWEQYYQAVRRCWRFGQEREVHVHIIATEGEEGIMKNLKRKAVQADRMFAALAKHANNQLHIKRDIEFPHTEKVPTWLSSTNA